MSQDIDSLPAALKALGAPQDELPEAAMRWALAHWDLARPALTQILARFARDPEGASDADFARAYFGVHLMAEKRETSAFPLARALARDPDAVGAMFGELGPMALARVMISLFDGDAVALRSLAASIDGDAFVRVAAFESLAWLAAAGRIDRGKTVEWLGSVAGAFGEDEDGLAAWEGWAVAAASLGIEDLMPRIRAVMAPDETADEDAREEQREVADEIEMIFRMAREETDPLAVFARDGVGPIDDAIAALRQNDEVMASLDEQRAGLEDDEGGEAIEPVNNPFRDVGRNDPCPCGSGRKFKKCCLAA